MRKVGVDGKVSGRRDPERMREPDVIYIERSKLEGQDPERLLRVIPDLVVEIDLTSAKKPGGQQRIPGGERGLPRRWVGKGLTLGVSGEELHGLVDEALDEIRAESPAPIK